MSLDCRWVNFLLDKYRSSRKLDARHLGDPGDRFGRSILWGEKWVERVNRVKCHALAAVVLSLIFYGKTWATLTINFDPQSGLPAGDLPLALDAMGNSPGSPVPSGAELSNQYDADGVLFSSSSPFVAVVGIGGSSASPPNGIGGVTSDGLLSYADPVTFTFVEPGTTAAGVTSNVSIQADDVGIPGQFATLSAFDVNDHLLDSVTLDDVGGEVWTIDLPGIHSAQFDFPTTSNGVPTTGSAFGSGTGIALDDLTFGTVAAAVSGTPVMVPLPAAVWSSLVLLASLAVVRARRRALGR
jgi:hypothetical protein